ncbi:MAG: thiol-disulfide oxidoreductase DCC family protein [Weeksellaceae bacterium]
MKSSKIVLFDGICNLCNSSVQLIIQNDSKNLFQFASLQSEFGQKFLQENNLPDDAFKSIVLIDGEKFYTKSEAVLRIGKELKGIYKVLGIFLWVPKFIRDFVYDYIARNRYKWYGKRNSCWIPTAELKQKFLD